MIYCTSSEDCISGIDIEVLSTDTFTYLPGRYASSLSRVMVLLDRSRYSTC